MLGILIIGAVLWVIAKILGGKGSYGNYVGTLALISAAFTGTINVLLAIIGVFTRTNLAILGIMGIIGLIVSLYSLFLFIKATQAVHDLSFIKALLVIIIPLIVLFVFAGAALLSLSSMFQQAGINPLQFGGNSLQAVTTSGAPQVVNAPGTTGTTTTTGNNNPPSTNPFATCEQSCVVKLEDCTNKCGLNTGTVNDPNKANEILACSTTCYSAYDSCTKAC